MRILVAANISSEEDLLDLVQREGLCLSQCLVLFVLPEHVASGHVLGRRPGLPRSPLVELALFLEFTKFDGGEDLSESSEREFPNLLVGPPVRGGDLVEPRRVCAYEAVWVEAFEVRREDFLGGVESELLFWRLRVIVGTRPAIFFPNASR